MSMTILHIFSTLNREGNPSPVYLILLISHGWVGRFTLCGNSRSPTPALINLTTSDFQQEWWRTQCLLTEAVCGVDGSIHTFLMYLPPYFISCISLSFLHDFSFRSSFFMQKSHSTLAWEKLRTSLESEISIAISQLY